MGLQNRCAFLDEKHRFTLKECEIPVPKADEVLIQIHANGICGSDIHFYAEGRLGNFVVTKPYIPGHEASGVVCTVGVDAADFQQGDRVVIEPGIPCGRCAFCREGRYNLCPHVVFFSAPPVNGTFCDYICVRSDFVHKIPDHLNFAHAALAEPTAVAVHAVNRAGQLNGKDGLILGSGPIGLLTLQVFKAMGGGKAIVADRMENRLELAKKLGADSVILSGHEPCPDNLADITFETAGSPVTTALSFSVTRPRGTVVQVGWPSGNMVIMNIADFIEKELVYTSVNRYANAYPAAIRYLSDGRVNAAALITHTYSFVQIEEAFRFAKENPQQVIKVIVEN